MALESLLKPIKNFDEYLLKLYTKLGKKWEDKGRDIKGLTLPLSGAGLALSLIPYNIVPLYPIYCATDSIRSLIEKDQEVISDTDAIDRGLYFFRKLHKNTRVYAFALGAGFTLKGLYDLYDFFVNKNNSQTEGIYDSLRLGLSLLSIASSIYLKDRNPKLLDKEPFVKEKKVLSPQLLSVPQKYSKLERNVCDL